MRHYIDILVTLGFLGALMWGMMKFMLRDILKELVLIRSDFSRELTLLREDISDLKQSQNRSEARTDHLYEENNRLYAVLIDLIQKR